MESLTSCLVCSGIKLGSRSSEGWAVDAPKLGCPLAVCPPGLENGENDDAPCLAAGGALCIGPMSRSGALCCDFFLVLAAAAGLGVSVKRSSPGMEEEEVEEGGGEDSKAIRLLLLACLELEAERGTWGEGDRRVAAGRGTDITCREVGTSEERKGESFLTTNQPL